MIVTREFCEKWFSYYNEKFFNGELPTPTFVLIETKTILGQFQCCRRLDAFANPYRQFFIRMSQYYDRPEHDLQETLVHEMIHYFISYKNIDDNGAHGHKWKSMADAINSKSDFHISRTTSVSGCKRSKDVAEKKKSPCTKAYMFAYKKYGQIMTFLVGETNVDKYKKWLQKEVNSKYSSIECGCAGIVNRLDFDQYSVCRTKVRGYFKSIDEFRSEIAPSMSDVEEFGKWIDKNI